MNRSALGTLVLACAISACGGDSATGPTRENLAGSYSGPVVGLAQGVALNATVSFTIAQNAGTLSGTWALSGTLSDGFSSTNVQGTGTLSGTVAEGNNPSVNITVFSPTCPNYSANFSGAYDVANRRLTMAGPIDIPNCTVFRRYQTTLIISR